LDTPAILVVDNDPNLQASLARALGSLAVVELAINGAQALRLLARKKYGLVLLDLNVRVIDGFVILRTLAAKAGPNRDTPIYVLTSEVSEHVRLRALREHAHFVLTKPVPIATVVTLVEAALRRPSLPPPAEKATAPSVPPPPASDEASAGGRGLGPLAAPSSKAKP
jgi:two-component system chemotaxis response regulator CheY